MRTNGGKKSTPNDDQTFDVGFTDDQGKTLLHYAVIDGGQYPEKLQGYSDITAKLLKQEGVDVDAKDNKGMAPLHYAAVTGNINAIALLINAGANLNIRDAKIPSPFEVALNTKQLVCANLLLLAAQQVKEGHKPFITREYIRRAYAGQHSEASPSL